MKHLLKKTKAATDRYHELSQQIKYLEKRMAEITELKKHIINYAKTKSTYTAYRESGFSRDLYGIHITEILNYNAAKNAFDKLIDLQIPSITKLNEELVKCRQRKRELSMSYRQTKTQFRESSVALSNVSRIFLIVNLTTTCCFLSVRALVSNNKPVRESNSSNTRHNS